MKKLLIRADAAPQMGTGHVMRCLALARAAEAAGFEALLAGRVEVPWVAERLKREGVSFQLLPGQITRIEDPRVLVSLIQSEKPDALVLDGYHFTLDSHKAARECGVELLVIDDYNHLPEYSADFLLNQNLGADELPYQGDFGRKLLGPAYALLRPEFRHARGKAESRVLKTSQENLLITLGGGDFSKYLLPIAEALRLVDHSGLTLRIIAGSMPSEKISHIFKHWKGQLEILSGVENMPDLLLDTDLAISAGGSTCWELCCLGVPFLTVEIAENQREVIAGLKKSGLADTFSARALEIKLKSYRSEVLIERSHLFAVTDGSGAMKACMELLNIR